MKTGRRNKNDLIKIEKNYYFLKIIKFIRNYFKL